MNSNCNQTAIVVTKPVLNFASLNETPCRNVEQARIAFLTRRLRIAPQLAAVVARAYFGEVRQ